MDDKERHKIRDLGQGRDWLRRTQLEEQIAFENRWIKESLVPDKHPEGVYRERFRCLSKTHPNPNLPPRVSTWAHLWVRYQVGVE